MRLYNEDGSVPRMDIIIARQYSVGSDLHLMHHWTLAHHVIFKIIFPRYRAAREPFLFFWGRPWHTANTWSLMPYNCVSYQGVKPCRKLRLSAADKPREIPIWSCGVCRVLSVLVPQPSLTLNFQLPVCWSTQTRNHGNIITQLTGTRSVYFWVLASRAEVYLGTDCAACCVHCVRKITRGAR